MAGKVTVGAGVSGGDRGQPDKRAILVGDSSVRAQNSVCLDLSELFPSTCPACSALPASYPCTARTRPRVRGTAPRGTPCSSVGGEDGRWRSRLAA